MTPTLHFHCDRTCKRFQECRFSPLHLAIGRTYVHSHTTRCQVEFKNRHALRAAVEAMQGEILGEGIHPLFSSQEAGFGFRLPGWNYPLIAKANGELAYDHYNGAWGKSSDIQTLIGKYAIEAARQAATEQGWMSDIQTDGSLIVYHPAGGTMTVAADGTVDAQGFTGQGCDAAQVIETAIGKESIRTNKSEYFAEHAVLQTREGGES
jgi:hypothetical protein